MKLRKLKKGETLEAGKWLAREHKGEIRNFSKQIVTFKVSNDYVDIYFEVLDFDPNDIETLPNPQPGELWECKRSAAISCTLEFRDDGAYNVDGCYWGEVDLYTPIRRLWVRPKGWEE